MGAEHANPDHGGDEDSERESIEEVELSRDELLALNPFDLPSFSRKKIRYMALFDTEKWASAFDNGEASMTFPTASAPVTWDEALAIKHAYQEGCCKHVGKVTANDHMALGRLQERIQGLLDELALRSPGQKCSFFVRLGPRSPKDAPMSPAEPWGLSETRIREALAACFAMACSAKKTAPEILRCFQRACSSLMRVASADEAMSLLVSSFRVMQDICHAMDHGREGWDVAVCARIWDEEVRLDREFRTFVVSGELVAVSQYDDQLEVDSALRDCVGEVVAAIRRALQQLKPGLQRLQLDGAVIVDFVVTAPLVTEAGTWNARCIELNPFGPMTGASLFDWHSNRRCLQGGADLFGDLSDWEAKYPPSPAGSLPDSCVTEQIIDAVPVRYLVRSSPAVTMSYLNIFWEDYMRLSPPSLTAPPTA